MPLGYPSLMRNRVLIFEPDTDLRHLLCIVLGEVGFEVSGAGTVEEAICKVEESPPPTLALVDLGPPGTSIVRLLLKLETSNIPHVTTSTRNGDGEHTDIRKPFVLEDLIRLLNERVRG